MDLRDNQMQRGLNQALYKYLPLSWIDFYKKVDRTAYTAFVKNWNSSILNGVNSRRLLMKVNQSVDEYRERGRVRDFVFPINEENYDVRTLESGINSDIITEVNPLTFFCGNCMKVHSYNTSDIFYKKNPRRKCTNCSGTLKQLKLVYSCSCGWAGPVKPIPCINKAHGYDHLHYSGKFTFYCSYEKHRKIEIRKKCPSCGKTLYSKNPLDMGNYIPLSLTMIDLVKTKLDDFVTENEKGPHLIVSHWLNQLSKDQLDKAVRNSGNVDSEEDTNRKIKELIDMYINQLNLPKEQAISIAKATVENEQQDKGIDAALNYISVVLTRNDLTSLSELALQFLEYDTVINPPRMSISTLENAIEVSKKLNTNARPEKYQEVAKQFGFNHVQASGDIPFIMCSYGFTRKETEPSKATLVGFPAETIRRKNVYATKLDTEGILFEIDRLAILKWLLKNNLIDEILDNVPEDLTDDAEVKAWFINKVNGKVINTFTPIDKESERITYYVYNLIHSISHALLRQAANLCGLDKNSLSEYIFPNVPAVLIYCQNSQGLNIGALFNVFEAYFDKWLQSTKDALEKCIFDPVCIDRDHACSGCLYLNEVSCVHFNKDLDRRLLIGWFDKSNKERFYGFWEEY